MDAEFVQLMRRVAHKPNIMEVRPHEKEPCVCYIHASAGDMSEKQGYNRTRYCITNVAAGSIVASCYG